MNINGVRPTIPLDIHHPGLLDWPTPHPCDHSTGPKDYIDGNNNEPDALNRFKISIYIVIIPYISHTRVLLIAAGIKMIGRCDYKL